MSSLNKRYCFSFAITILFLFLLVGLSGFSIEKKVLKQPESDKPQKILSSPSVSFVKKQRPPEVQKQIPLEVKEPETLSPAPKPLVEKPMPKKPEPKKAALEEPVKKEAPSEIEQVASEITEEAAPISDYTEESEAPVMEQATQPLAPSPDQAAYKAFILNCIAQKKVYPLQARKKGQTGKVFLHIVISEDGSLVTMEITKASEHKLLNEAAINAVKKSIPYINKGPAAVALDFTFAMEFLLS